MDFKNTQGTRLNRSLDADLLHLKLIHCTERRVGQ